MRNKNKSRCRPILLYNNLNEDLGLHDHKILAAVKRAFFFVFVPFIGLNITTSSRISDNSTDAFGVNVLLRVSK